MGEYPDYRLDIKGKFNLLDFDFYRVVILICYWRLDTKNLSGQTQRIEARTTRLTSSVFQADKHPRLSL